MAINFPNNPSNSDTFDAAGVTFVYNSTKGTWTPQNPSENSSSVTVYATVDNLPNDASAGDQAFVTATNRLYISNGSGWYNIALINTTPSISGADSSYALATDGTPTVITITATDPEGLPITYSIASDTSGNIATVTSNNNIFTITPTTNTADGGIFSLTFRASDGVNIATAVSEFTLQFTVNNSNYTTALITSVGANDAVNNTFVDSSTNSHTITAVGNATQTTFSPYRHGGYSTYFDGTGDYIRYQDASLAEGTDDFTVEFWVRRDGTQSLNDTIVGHDTTPGWQICFNSDGSTIRWMSNATDASRVLPASLNDQQWHHVVYQRDSGTLQGFLDGVSLGTASVSTDFTNNIIEIGVNRGGTAYFKGNVRDVRIIKGTAFYSSSGFDVPTEPLTAVSGTGYSTTLLTCHLPYIADGGANSLSPTVNGNTKTEPLAPYDYSKYASGDYGGSTYHDGSGDYLTISNQSAITLGSGDFCVECWTYLNSRDNDRPGIWSNYGVGGFDASAIGLVAGHGNSTTTQYQVVGNYTGGSSFIINAGTILYNEWVHLAVVRNSGTIYLYVNGVQEGSASLSQDFNKDDMWIGVTGDNTAKGINGHVSDFRVVVGSPVYTSAFTPPTAPLTAITNTSLLLSGTNAGIIDKSQSVKTITLNGDVKSSTTQSKYLSSSMYFDGTGDSLTIGNNQGLHIGSGDFTMEMWFRAAAVNTNQVLIMRRASATARGFVININSSVANKLGFVAGDTNTAAWEVSMTSTSDLSADTWHHIAIVRSGNNFYLYLDGTQEASVSSSVTIADDTSNMLIGVSDSASSYFSGYLSDLRITKGLARYTANFTPPTAALQG